MVLVSVSVEMHLLIGWDASFQVFIITWLLIPIVDIMTLIWRHLTLLHILLILTRFVLIRFCLILLLARIEIKFALVWFIHNIIIQRMYLTLILFILHHLLKTVSVISWTSKTRTLPIFLTLWLLKGRELFIWKLLFLFDYMINVWYFILIDQSWCAKWLPRTILSEVIKSFILIYLASFGWWFGLMGRRMHNRNLTFIKYNVLHIFVWFAIVFYWLSAWMLIFASKLREYMFLRSEIIRVIEV